jgi:hypothetical protein
LEWWKWVWNFGGLAPLVHVIASQTGAVSEISSDKGGKVKME